VCVCVCVCDDTTMIDTGWWCYCRWTCCCDDGNFEEREVGVDLTRQRSSRESRSFDVKPVFLREKYSKCVLKSNL
jgi:hypothetical protein